MKNTIYEADGLYLCKTPTGCTGVPYRPQDGPFAAKAHTSRELALACQARKHKRRVHTATRAHAASRKGTSTRNWHKRFTWAEKNWFVSMVDYVTTENARNKSIFTMYMNGGTLARMEPLYGICGERISQIIYRFVNKIERISQSQGWVYDLPRRQPKPPPVAHWSRDE